MTSPVAKDILANNYVDNIITGCSTITEATQYYQVAKKVFNSVSMNLREWYSNSEEFMHQIAEKDRGLATNVVMVLGLPWDLKADTLGCTSKASKDLVGVPATKRSILRIAASVYDPCGYITPITVQAKLLLQSLWRRGCDWDVKIPEDLQKNWDGCLLNLCKVKEIRFDRFQGSLTDSVCELHIFCDAAKPAYGAVAYQRVETGTQVRCDLVFAKSRVSPAKNQTLTIPKLELTAMVVGCRMAKFLQTQFDVSETYIWGDSQCALHWAMGGESSMTYVQHRVKQIKEMGEWTLRHVPREHNPADLLTRDGITAEKLKDCRFWWSGPAWLTQDAATWPPIPTALNHEEEPSLEPEEIVMVSYVYPSSLLKFSKWSKVLRVTSYTIRFIYNCKARKLGLQRRTGPLSAAEVKHAKERWVKLAQEPLVQALEKKPSPQHVRQLGMFLDSKGFLRCSGQLDYSDLPKSTKYPLALPKDSPINRLLIVDMHHRLMHAGTSHVLAELRQEYWIINARSQVKQVRVKCQVCRREKGGRFRTPQPAPLPDFRACRGECFSRVGLDYLGPVYYRDGKKSVKAWICLFTCALSRAIHLEVIPDMTAEQFLLALRRFMALYGKPDLIVCDNAKTFHSSQLATNQLFREAVHHNSVRGYTSSRGIDWKFVVEMAPWMGGFYERMVSLVKDRFKCAVQRKRLTYVELQTVCAEVSGILNSRPLTRDEDEVGTEVLTPNHFITHTRASFPAVDTDDVDDPDYRPGRGTDNRSVLIGKWKRIQAIVDQFWTTWQRQYLVSLRERHWLPNNHGASQLTPKVGAIVLVKEENLPRGRWRIGKITDLDTSFDTICRSATVTLSDKSRLRRPLKLLYPIEVPLEAEALSENGRTTESEPTQLADTSFENESQEF